MWKKHMLVMLPTKGKSKICLSANKLNIFHGIEPDNEKLLYQHLYILSDEEIKENTHTLKEGLNGDWFYNTKFKSIARTGDITEFDFKIIASTDTSLDLPELSKSFIEEYVKEYNKGNKIEEVMVEYEELPDEWMTELEDCPHKDYECRLKLNSDNTINIKRVKDSFTRDEVQTKLHHLYSDMTTDSTYDGVWYDEWIEENL